VKYHTEDEYINKNLSAIARNTKTPIDEVIEFYESSIKSNNKRKSLVYTHNYYKREYYWKRKKEMENW